MRVRRGRERQAAAMAAAARHLARGQGAAASAVDAAAQFVGQTLLGIGEAGVRMLLTAPEQWTPETLGRTLGRSPRAGTKDSRR